MAETIVDGTILNPNNIKYSAPKLTSVGGKSVNILNKLTNTGLRLSTPLMLTWGASEIQEVNSITKEKKGRGEYDMSLQFPQDEYKNAETDAFLSNLILFEKKVKTDALMYSKDWFGKEHKSSDVIDALWNPILKYPKLKDGSGEIDYSKQPTLRVKLPKWEGIFKVEIYDEDSNKMFPNENPLLTPMDFLTKGINVACILQCGGLWFIGGKFGITWKLIQAMAQKPRPTLSGQCFIKLKASDKDKLKNSVVPDEVEVETDVVGESTIVEDSEDEEEVKPSSPVPVPTPVPFVAPKKIVKKVKT
jgi:hypothetical protein